MIVHTPAHVHVESNRILNTVRCEIHVIGFHDTLFIRGFHFTHTTPALVPSLRRTAGMAVRVSPAMSPSLSASIAEVAAMSDSTFRKRFSRVMMEDEGVEESSDSDSESKDAEDEGFAANDEGLAAGGEALAARDEGPDIRVKSLGLGGDEAVYEGQGYGFVPEPERPKRVSAFRQPTLPTWIDPEDGRTYIDVPAYPPLAPPVQTPPYPEWSSGSLPISPAHSIVSSPISSPMISLTVPLPVASPATTEAEGFLTELGAQVEMQGGLIYDHTVRLGELSPALFERSLEHEKERTVMTVRALWRPVLALEAWARPVDTRMADMSRGGYDDHRLVHDMLVQQAALQRELQEMRGRVTALELERDRREQQMI
ncbi:hypothetical protein Tco_0674278 [Tanacetum coccineum]